MTWRSGHETALDVGRLCAVSRHLHGILGRAALQSERPPLTVAFDEWSLEHGWHGDVLFERLPLRADFSRERVIVLDELAPSFAVLEDFAAGGHDLELLGAYGDALLPLLVSSFGSVATQTSDSAERALRRSIRLITSDLMVAQERSRELEQTLGASNQERERLAAGSLAFRDSFPSSSSLLPS